MNTFANAVIAEAADTENVGCTYNGAATLLSSMDAFTDLFAVIGSSRKAPANAVAQFRKCYAIDRQLALRIMLWARDARGGAGERNIFRLCVDMLTAADKLALIDSGKIEELGRWDDYIGLMMDKNDRVARAASTRVLEAIKAGNGLAAKWMPRKGAEAARIRSLFGMAPKLYRKMLVEGTRVVETQMCAKNWEGITYEHVPSVAMARYSRAFARNSQVAFPAYKAALEAGTVQAKAAALFPYDVARTLKGGDTTIANEQWKALPNYIDGKAKLFPIIDVSGSMTCPVTGTITAMDVAITLGLYIAERQTSALKDLFMTFDDKPRMVSVAGCSSFKARYNKIKDAPWGGSTNLQASFELLLKTAVDNQVAPEDMPEYLFIVSDMEFNIACGNGYWQPRKSETNFAEIERKYRASGYRRPNVIFWNVNARGQNLQVEADQNGTAMISGFSPSILRPLLNAEQISPRLIMEAAVMVPRYTVNGLTA